MAAAETPLTRSPGALEGGAAGTVSATSHATCPVTLRSAANGFDPETNDPTARHALVVSSHTAIVVCVPSGMGDAGESVTCIDVCSGRPCGATSTAPTGDQPSGSVPCNACEPIDVADTVASAASAPAGIVA